MFMFSNPKLASNLAVLQLWRLDLISGLLRMLGCSVSHRFPDYSSGANLNRRSSCLRLAGTLRFSLSYRDVEELLAERGLHADHVTVWGWGPALRPGNGTTFALEAQAD
jgi:hypothetical protein